MQPQEATHSSSRQETALTVKRSQPTAQTNSNGSTSRQEPTHGISHSMQLFQKTTSMISSSEAQPPLQPNLPYSTWAPAHPLHQLPLEQTTPHSQLMPMATSKPIKQPH